MVSRVVWVKKETLQTVVYDLQGFELRRQDLNL